MPPFERPKDRPLEAQFRIHSRNLGITIHRSHFDFCLLTFEFLPLIIMKKIYLLFASLLLAACLHAQTAFEGIITYKLKNFTENGDDAELKVYFGKNALRLKFREKEFFNMEELVVRIDSGKTYTLNTTHKTYFGRPLFIAKPPVVRADEKTIAGYKTQSEERIAFSVSTVLGDRFRASQLLSYTAPELFFPVPDSLRINPEFLVVHNNHIALRLEARFAKTFDISDDRAESFTMEAVEVIPMTVPSADFMIPPAGYTEDRRFAADDYMMDSLAVVVDTVVSTEVWSEPPPPPPPRAAPMPAKKKKNGQTSPARKPD